MYVTPSVCLPPMFTPKLMTIEGTLMAMILASPPRPRCKQAACWDGVIVPVVTLTQACTSRTKSRKGTFPAGSQCGPVVRVSSEPRCM